MNVIMGRETKVPYIYIYIISQREKLALPIWITSRADAIENHLGSLAIHMAFSSVDIIHLKTSFLCTSESVMQHVFSNSLTRLDALRLLLCGILQWQLHGILQPAYVASLMEQACQGLGGGSPH